MEFTRLANEIAFGCGLILLTTEGPIVVAENYMNWELRKM